MKSPSRTKREGRARRHARIRATVIGSSVRPRLCVFRSLSGMELQLIDDAAGKTLVSVRTTKKALSGDTGDRTGKVAQSYLLGKVLAEKAKEKNIVSVVFDRGGNAYHGRVRAAAEGARDSGLQF